MLIEGWGEYCMVNKGWEDLLASEGWGRGLHANKGRGMLSRLKCCMRWSMASWWISWVIGRYHS